MITYAQNFEDVILNRVFGARSSGFYIDLGAMDPVDGSVTKTFYDRGWHGINVEPDARFYARLVADRQRDINLNIAVGEAEEVRSLYCFEQPGIATFNPRFRDYFAGRGQPWTEAPCRLTTLGGICREYVTGPIDFLKLDIEGWEGPSLRGGDWQRFRPVVLVIEATEPFSHVPAWEDWEPFVTGECGYVFVYFDGLNRFYLRRENMELQPLFAYPPNVLDGFDLYSRVEAQRRCDQAQAETARCKVEIDSLRKDLDELRRRTLMGGF